MSSFSPTPSELALVNSIFAKADPQKLGIVTGDKAVEAFAGANLPPNVLGEIWALADKENNGFLTRKGVAVALRLIGHAQKGEQLNESSLERPGPLAHIEGLSSRPSSIPSSPPPKSPPARGVIYPPLTPEDKSKFLRLFLGCGPVNGLLNGDKARDVFVKSKLPFEKLSHIWSLADTQDRGMLDQTDFTIAMYFIQAIMSGQLSNLPATLPPGLYEQAGGRAPAAVTSHGTGGSVSSMSPSLSGAFPPPAPLAVQTTGSGARRLQPQATGQEYNRFSMAIPPQQQQPSVHFAQNSVTALGASAFGGAQQPWDVTPEEKTRFDQYFDGLDSQKRGFIEGDVAVPFMLQSKLSEDVLAQVWDLADLNNDGRLTRDGFAVAMHLIQGKLAGKDIPAALPLSLVPPSMRAPRLSGAAPAPAPAVPEPVRDLLWDDSPPASATAQQHTIPPVNSPPITQATPVLHPQTTGRISQQPTGAIAHSPPVAPAIPARPTDPFGASPFTSPAHRDLLSDDEATTSAAVPDNSAEIGNVQNQINSTNRSLESTKAERQNIETTLATQASQLSALQTQLSSAKAAYETETKLLETLRERFATQSADIAKTREELIRAESDLSAIRVEKAEVEGSVLRDKEEVRELQRRMKEVGEETEHTKAAIEKAKKETKHQKGLLAIAKKQLATREAERAKAVKELEESERETNETQQGLEATEAELAKEPAPIQANGIASPLTHPEPLRTDTPSFAAAQPLPASPSMSPPPAVGSPSMKTNNPFGRLVMQSTGSRPASPFAAPASDIFSVPTPPTQTEASQSSESPFAPVVASEKLEDAPRAASPHVVAAEPSSSTSAPSAIDDPFGLSEGGKESSATSVAESPEKPVSPESKVKPEAESSEPQVLTSLGIGESESTPKVHESSSLSEAINDAAKQFPAIETQIPGGLPVPDDAAAGHTDLNSQLLEKEEGSDSDSDSDNDGDFHDAKEARTSIGSPVDSPAKVSAIGAVADAAHSAPVANSSAFEDAFGLKESEPKAEPTTNGLPASKDSIADLFFSPSTATYETPANGKVPERSSPFDNVQNATSGVNAFDEAMGKISAPSSSTAPQFKLDSAFDDNFDFTAAKAELDPSASSFPSAPVVNGSSQGPVKTPSMDLGSAFVPASSAQDTVAKAQEESKPAFSFDDAFGSVGPSQVASQPSAGDHGISFEDTFGGGSDKALALDFNAPQAASPTVMTEPRQAEPETTPFPVQSPPTSPKAAPTQASPSTVRSATPPPRRSTGSSTEGPPSVKPPPQHRHSKLSIRLPFGRKDKKKAKHNPPPMPPPQHLTTVAEPAGGSHTPAVEDDVEPVKQLCGMGFSRVQAVTALEKHGYDVQRALNSLLGSA
ncbi:uncharacterized protein FOMMEDRAFT_124323 [Fomitiporia mediterranea MF3/22]|uniref:uncharacterized protein n=1 Tax=Fomitiporia mediterranea (strain MF3/22) TaxID=694068 RepID=UPI00044079D4|nr:uncharacterized protein FOMMEDRAFT_124323 [Fomitiporia mediterranea MF3/22]EJD02096.1 hypothetical protein FOMMEDRAFT_124323 [Fomitiporia mediterranea MF3/22]